MNEKEWLAYRNRLLDAGISRRIVTRHIRELRDHRDELAAGARACGFDGDAALAAAQGQLGAPEMLAEAMLARPELRGMLHRHPVLWTIVAPPVLLILAGILALVLLIAAVSVFYVDNPVIVQTVPAWMALAISAFRLFLMYLLTPLLASAFCRVVIREHVPARYWTLGAALLCLLGSGIHMSFELPDPATARQGVMGAGIAFPLGAQATVMEYGRLALRLVMNILLCAGFAWQGLKREHADARA